MKSNMLSTAQVAKRLGIKRQSVYAYVSRGQLTRWPAADGKSSMFRAAEVEALAQRGRPRAGQSTVGSVQVSLTTSITAIEPTRLAYRGHDVCDLALRYGFESVAELLWSGALVAGVRWSRAQGGVAALARRMPKGSSPLERFSAVLAELAADDPLRIDLSVRRVMTAGTAIVHGFLASMPLIGAAPGRNAESIAAQLWPRLTPLKATAERIALLNSSLVLLADHELATSTLAARIAASTRAHPFAVVMAGLATLSGPLHGKAAERVQRVLRAALHTEPPALAFAEMAAESRLAPGFGHPVYSDGDVRARALLPRVLAMAKTRERTVIEAVREQGARTTGSAPNVDFALAALAFATEMPLGATEAIFAIARSAGLLAHGLEEYGEAPLRFRARAMYVGPG